jgi:protease I
LAITLIPIPSHDFDPTETAVPWSVLTKLGHAVTFATPDGQPGQADERMITGRGLGVLRSLLIADSAARRAYDEMTASASFQKPRRHAEVSVDSFDGLILPGGHAPGMRPYLESTVLQALIVAAFANRKAVGAICHGVVLAARSRTSDGRSVLFGRKTTALLRKMELTAWALTAAWLGSYYRTYATTVQDEVTAALASPADFVTGRLPTRRDAPTRLNAGFAVRDGQYVSARWPGDSHRFANEFARLLVRESGPSIP